MKIQPMLFAAVCVFVSAVAAAQTLPEPQPALGATFGQLGKDSAPQRTTVRRTRVAWLEGATDFLDGDVDDRHGPLANSYEAALDSSERARAALHKIKRHYDKSKRNAASRLLRQYKDASRQLSRAGKLLGFIDLGSNFIGGATSVYYGDYVGGGQELANAIFSGAAASGGATGGAYGGAVFGGLVLGPPGALIGGTVGGVSAAVFSSFLYDATGRQIVDGAADRVHEAWLNYSHPREVLATALRHLNKAKQLLRDKQYKNADHFARLAIQGATYARRGDLDLTLSAQASAILAEAMSVRAATVGPLKQESTLSEAQQGERNAEAAETARTRSADPAPDKAQSAPQKPIIFYGTKSWKTPQSLEARSVRVSLQARKDRIVISYSYQSDYEKIKYQGLECLALRRDWAQFLCHYVGDANSGEFQGTTEAKVKHHGTVWKNGTTTPVRIPLAPKTLSVRGRVRNNRVSGTITGPNENFTFEVPVELIQP